MVGLLSACRNLIPSGSPGWPAAGGTSAGGRPPAGDVLQHRRPTGSADRQFLRQWPVAGEHHRRPAQDLWAAWANPRHGAAHAAGTLQGHGRIRRHGGARQPHRRSGQQSSDAWNPHHRPRWRLSTQSRCIQFNASTDVLTHIDRYSSRLRLAPLRPRSRKFRSNPHGVTRRRPERCLSDWLRLTWPTGRDLIRP